MARQLHLCCTIPGSEKFGNLHNQFQIWWWWWWLVLLLLLNDFHSTNIKIKFIYLFCNGCIVCSSILTKTPLHKNVQTTHTQSFLEICIMMLLGNINSTLLWKNTAAQSSLIFNLLLQKHWRILTPKTHSKRIATTRRDRDGARIEGANSREKKHLDLHFKTPDKSARNA